MNFGLTQQQIDELYKIFRSHPEITEVVIFGSRAQGTNKQASDIDFALKGQITIDLLAKVKYELEETTSLPYFFDVVDYHHLSNNELKHNIEQQGKLFYKKNQN